MGILLYAKLSPLYNMRVALLLFTHKVIYSLMCDLSLPVVAVLFPNDSLPQDTTAVTGEPAIFSCDVQTTRKQGPAFTVGFVVRLLTSDDLHTCYNCSFSSATLNNCIPPVKEGICSGFVVHYVPTGHPQLQTHHLTANWTAPSSDAAVICAIASSGVTQWARTATLSVLAPSNIPSSASPSPASPRHPQLAGLAALSLLAAVGGALLLGLLVCLRRRHRRQLANSSQPPPEESESLFQHSLHSCHLFSAAPLSMESLPSSGTATPTLTHPPTLPAIQLDSAMVDHSRHLQQALQMYSDSQDSGLDLTTTVKGQGSKVSHIYGCHGYRVSPHRLLETICKFLLVAIATASTICLTLRLVRFVCTSVTVIPRRNGFGRPSCHCCTRSSQSE